MPKKVPYILSTALASALLAGCENAPPGGGLTNGPPPSVLGAEDKPAVRTDLQEPGATGGDAAVAASVPPVTGPAPAAPESAPKDTPSGGKGSEGTAKPSEGSKDGTPRSPQ